MLTKTRPVVTQVLRGQVHRSYAARPFSLSSMRRQDVNESRQNDRTTHFGFETVAEAEKEGRGK